ncbi:MAG: UDP-3-O-(3-hydroxymyristoyl)glucosamine N-acyltransferase [Alphaproteobacteria bacterium]|nr:UDP-3-O-(3-hydroxymyristoyl)glucosamine N-acyltransferase [Alphaproteobacteria bacterium]
MADSRFFTRKGPFSLAQLAQAAHATLERAEGGAETLISDVAPLERAGPEEISFLDNVKYVEAFRGSRAGACFVRPKFAAAAPAGMALLVTPEPYAGYALIARMFYPPGFTPHISPRATIAESAAIGARCRIEAGAWIGEGVVMGDDCFVGANATISHAIIGHRAMIHPGAHIGQDGFGFAPSPSGIIKVPQLGRVMIGNDVEIGAGTCIDRGAGPDTVIGDFCKIDNLVQIGHNCVLGTGVIIAGQAGLSGSTRVDDFAMLGGQVGFAGHTTVGKGAKVAARSGIMHDIPPGETWGGAPAIPIRQFHRQTAAIARLAKKGEEA